MAESQSGWSWRIYDTLCVWLTRLFDWLTTAIPILRPLKMVKGWGFLLPAEEKQPDPLFNALYDIPDLPSEFKGALDLWKWFVNKSEIPLAGIPIIMAINQVLEGYLSPLSVNAAFYMSRKLQTSRPDPTTAMLMAFRHPESEGYLKEMLRDQGWSEGLIGEFKAITRKYPDVAENMQLLWRGEVGEQQFKIRLSQLGYGPSSIANYLALTKRIPGPGDLVRFSVREAFRDDIAAQYGYDEEFPTEFAEWMEKNGYDRHWATRFWRAHWDLPSLTSGYEMLQRSIINRGELETLLKIRDVPSYWRERLVQVAYRPFTRVDVRRMYGLGVLSEEQVTRAYKDLGYDQDKAEAMTEFTIRYEGKGGTNKLEDYKEMTYNQIIRAVRRGVITADEGVFYLTEIGYHQEDAEFLVEMELTQQQANYVGDVASDYHRIMVRALDKARSDRVLSISQYREGLRNLGYSNTEALMISDALDYAFDTEQLDNAIDQIGGAYSRGYIDRDRAVLELNRLDIVGARQTYLFETWDANRRIPGRRLTEAQYRRCLQNNIITVEKYRERMKDLGYAPEDINLLVAMAVG